MRESETEMYYADPEKGENKNMVEVETNMLHHQCNMKENILLACYIQSHFILYLVKIINMLCSVLWWK